MNKTKIDWADATFNPVTGCFHGCEYCYARRIAERFSTADKCHSFIGGHPIGKIHELEESAIISESGRKSPYPFGFEPTFHRYRLCELQHKRSHRIFLWVAWLICLVTVYQTNGSKLCSMHVRKLRNAPICFLRRIR